MVEAAVLAHDEGEEAGGGAKGVGGGLAAAAAEGGEREEGWDACTLESGMAGSGAYGPLRMGLVPGEWRGAGRALGAAIVRGGDDAVRPRGSGRGGSAHDRMAACRGLGAPSIPVSHGGQITTKLGVCQDA
mgnify:CR=1 FL=1